MTFRTTLAGASLGLLAALPGAAQQSENAVRFAYGQTLESPDPYFTTLRLGVILGRNVWDTLVVRNLETGEFEPLLATEWEWVDDTTLDLTLREGVTFHDGSTFEADDVVYTLSYAADPANRIVSQQVANWIESVEKTGEHSVRITTTGPTPAALEFVSSQLAIMPSDHYTGPGGTTDADLPIGTGPFRYAEYSAGGEIVLERFEDYTATDAKSAASLDRVSIRTIPDQQTQIAELLSGGLDLTMGLPKDQADQLAQMPGVEVQSGETMRIVFMQINTSDDTPNPALQDVRVRRALNHAIDKAAISENLVGEGSNTIDTVCFIDQFGCTDEGATSYPFDPDKARALLEEAGYGDGLTVELYAYRERHISEAVINYLSDVGVNVKLNFMQPAAMRDAMRAREVELAQNAWGSYSIYDLSASTPVYFGGQPDDNALDSELIETLDDAGKSMDTEERKTLYRQALQRIADEALAVPMFTLPVYYAGAEGLSYETYPDEILRFWEFSWSE
ncbi:ABC transporter substrate-binding protein [Roseicyclus sp. F158]|uniref:ABC transporter substrate-binding protein n=1 Tax=Tropicimonas omnivorans TaxID=3075590 RepID=A0ABU3DED8_9RHOB|nr:ABC transporter substrate-binding protein [Roseicyclus sp. F158]MDT0682081.1 ABC transporter substrate-binding protein [Roseicyclus sp. F158]